MLLLSFEQLLRMINNTVSKARSVNRLVQSEKFKEAWDNSDDYGKLTVQNIIGWLNKDKLEEWIIKHLERDYGEMTLEELRTAARNKGIKYYRCKSKSTLLSELARREYDEG